MADWEISLLIILGSMILVFAVVIIAWASKTLKALMKSEEDDDE